MGGGGPAAVNKDERTELHEGRTTWFVIMTALVAASGGLMFGYDNGVSGGVSAMNPFLKKFFPVVYEAKIAGVDATNPYCKYNNQKLQTFTSVLFLAGLVSSFPAAWVTSKKGRKKSMIIAGASYMIGCILLAAAEHIAMLYIGRVILGIGVGFAIQSATLYNSEMAPAKLRGALNILFQLMVTIGILVAQLINYGTQHHEWGWRLSLGLAFIPAFILFMGGLLLPETPNSLIERGHLEEAQRVLRRIRGTDNIQVEYEDILMATQQAQTVVTNPYVTLMKRQYRPQLIITILMPLFQQFTGINAIIFYSPVFFSSLGSGDKVALESSCIVGAVNVLATLVAVFGVDRLGRRTLLLEAGFQMFIAEAIVAVLLGVYFGSNTTELPHSVAVGVIVLICVFIAAFAWSWGPLGWLIPSEIHPLETRSAGQGINVTVNLLFTFVIGQCFLSMLCTMQYGVFIFFGAMVVVMTTFTYFFIPETKGLLIEDVHEVFAAHWFWSRMGAVAHHKDIEGRPSMVGGVDVLQKASLSQSRRTVHPAVGAPMVEDPAIAKL